MDGHAVGSECEEVDRATNKSSKEIPWGQGKGTQPATTGERRKKIEADLGLANLADEALSATGAGNGSKVNLGLAKLGLIPVKKGGRGGG